MTGPKSTRDDQLAVFVDSEIARAMSAKDAKAAPRITKAVQSAINAAVDAQIQSTVAAKFAEHMTIQPPRRVTIHATFETAKFQPLEIFSGNRVPSELEELLDNPPVLGALATERMQPRHIPVALVIIQDPLGATRAGIEVRLLDTAGQLLDRTKTDEAGLALLRFPVRAAGAVANGSLAVAGVATPVAVSVAPDVQHAVADITLDDELPPLPVPAPGAVPLIPTGDDPLSRLPADFSPGLCDALRRLRTNTKDPILGGVAGAGDFRQRRPSLIKRLSVFRIGELPTAAGPPRRYLVRLRQEWTFMGYTLGELSDIDALDPGAVVRQATDSVGRTVDTVERGFDEVTQEARSLLSNSLRQVSSIDAVLDVATRAETAASASGFAGIGAGGGIGGGLFGGIAGGVLGPIGAAIGGLLGGVGGGIGAGFGTGTRAGTSLSSSNTTRSRTETSLVANSLMHSASSTLNRAVHMATSALRDMRTQVLQQVDHISPLLSRVTNLLRWTVYETYAVCTNVEDVVEIRSVRITEPPGGELPLFTDEDCVEYRPIFEPALLEPQLASRFPVLRQAVQHRLSGGSALSRIHVAVDFSAALFGATLDIRVGDRMVTLDLTPGRTSMRTTLFITPTLPAQLDGADLMLRARIPSISILGVDLGAIFNLGGVTISQLRFWYEASPAAVADQTLAVADLAVSNTQRTAQSHVDLDPKPRFIDTSNDPLFRHINRNRTYYFGLLAQAALVVPSLRDDAPELANFSGDHALWRLPIVGFEGDRVLIISDVERDAAGEVIDPDAKRLLEDPGAGTIMQLAAPGAYAEALQGLLELTGDVAGKVHPALIPLPAPVMPPLAIVDLAGRTLTPVGPGATSPAVPTTPGAPGAPTTPGVPSVPGVPVP